MYGPKAIETVYNGYRFRSRLEARWAVFFDALGIEWEYEKEGFDLGDGVKYLPDFWLPAQKCWVEVKGEMPECEDKSYQKIERMRELSEYPVYVVFGQIGKHRWDVGSDITSYWKPVKIIDSRSAMGKMIAPVMQPGPYIDNTICCPVCGNNCIHLNEALETELDNDFAAKVVFDCEQGHHFILEFRYHEGYTWFNFGSVTETLDKFCSFLANHNEALYEKAIDAAKSARFEFGQNGKSVQAKNKAVGRFIPYGSKYIEGKTTSGVITSVRAIPHKRGGTMAFVHLDNNPDYVVFDPDIYDEYKKRLNLGSSIVVTGDLYEYENKISLYVNIVW